MVTARLPRKVIEHWRLLYKYAKGKVVLNIGCANWPFTEERLKNKTLTQYFLSKISKKAYGIDISKEGINLLRKYGLENVFVWDVYKLEQLEIEDKIEVIVFMEVVEHLINPGKALKSIKNFMEKNNRDAILIISAPNIFKFEDTLFEFLFGKENIHEDHKFYFSSYTLQKLLKEIGFKIMESYFMYSRFHLPKFNIIKGKRRILRILTLKLFPWTAPSVVAIAKL